MYVSGFYCRRIFFAMVQGEIIMSLVIMHGSDMVQLCFKSPEHWRNRGEKRPFRLENADEGIGALLLK